MTHKLSRFFKLPTTSLSWWQKIWLLSPLAIWFSYHPLIRLGANESTNFELSITVVYILILALYGIPAVWNSRKMLIKNRAAQLVSGFVVLSGASIMWSANQVRGVLTLGMVGLIYLIFLAALAQAKQLKQIIPALTRLLVASAVLMSVLSLVQLVAGIWLGRSTDLLCPGCTAAQFGFPRPNVFTIEPQFLGNLLLAPLLILLNKLLSAGRERFVGLSFYIIVTALFLTLSRGAIFAFGISAVVVFIYSRPNLSRFRSVAGLGLLSFITCLFIQGTAAVLSPSIKTSFVGAARASINQLSLGVVDLQPGQSTTASPAGGEAKPSPTPAATQNAAPSQTGKKMEPNFNGYVAESTNVRVKLAKLALRSWHGNMGRTLFGVGLGGSGVVLHREFPDQVNPHEIVQNQFAELLLENGLVGFGLFMFILAGLFIALGRTRWLWAFPVAYLVQWNFFSGYPNSLHLYLVLVILLNVAVVSKNQLKKASD